MMIALYILGGIVLLIVILGLIAPKELKVHRSVFVNKSADVIFNDLKNLKNHHAWSPWDSKDPNMTKSYKGEDGEVGSVYHWSGNNKVGEGEQEIIKLTPHSRIDIALRFLKPWKATNDAYFTINPKGDGCEVTWGFRGDNKFPLSIMMMFMNMDKLMGKDFEQGMEAFKKAIEN